MGDGGTGGWGGAGEGEGEEQARRKKILNKVPVIKNFRFIYIFLYVKDFTYYT